MDFTKYMVEKLYNEFIDKGIVVVPVYDIKTVDIKRDNFLTVYTNNRTNTPASIGGNAYFEDINIMFDFRGGDYKSYLFAKNRLKAWVEKNVRGFKDLGVYYISYDTEDELSDKQRGMYRFVITISLSRLTDYEKDIIFYDDFNIPKFGGSNIIFSDDFSEVA